MSAARPPPVHHATWASQPHVRFACESITRYVWAGAPDAGEGVYTADGRHAGDPSALFTYDAARVTCKRCAHEAAP